MIGYLRGILRFKFPDPAIIDVGGVGYSVHIHEHLLEKMSIGDTCTLFIYSHIREDMFDLYGFTTQTELQLFKLLLTVSGIGPKTSLMIVSRGVDAIHIAITSGDTDFFTGIPRLGKKNAQKIIIELRPKLGSLNILDLSQPEQELAQDVMNALETMGFGKAESLQAMKKITPADITVEQQIRRALKTLHKG